jgi:hypothetical protein
LVASELGLGGLALLDLAIFSSLENGEGRHGWWVLLCDYRSIGICRYRRNAVER